MRILLAIAAAIAIIAGVAVQQLWPKAEPKALVYDPARAIPEFSLESTAAASVGTESLVGQWTLLFTGYTYCPDICPTTMADLRRIMPTLSASTDVPVKVWMISVDPPRDDIERLTQYTGFFGPEFVGVRGEHPQLYPFVTNLGLMYSVPDEGATDYLVNHSAAIILVNPAGHLQAIFKAEHVPGKIPTVNMDQLAADFALIADAY